MKFYIIKSKDGSYVKLPYMGPFGNTPVVVLFEDPLSASYRCSYGNRIIEIEIKEINTLDEGAK